MTSRRVGCAHHNRRRNGGHSPPYTLHSPPGLSRWSPVSALQDCPADSPVLLFPIVCHVATPPSLTAIISTTRLYHADGRRGVDRRDERHRADSRSALAGSRRSGTDHRRRVRSAGCRSRVGQRRPAETRPQSRRTLAIRSRRGRLGGEREPRGGSSRGTELRTTGRRATRPSYFG